MRMYLQAHTYNKQTQQVHNSNNHNNNMKKAGQSHSSIKTIFFSYKSIIQNNLRVCVSVAILHTRTQTNYILGIKSGVILIYAMLCAPFL